MDVVSIYDIQYTTDPSGDSPYADQTVMTEGVVVAVEPGNSYVWIQDGQGPWSGLLVFDPPAELTVGDLVRVSGNLKEYFGMTEISPTDTCVILANGQPVPSPEVLPTGDVGQEQWESVFVRVENVTVTEEPNQYNEWLVDDGSGDIMINDQFAFSYTPTLGAQLLYIQGPLDYSFSNFKIEPRSDADIAPEGVNTSTPTSPPASTNTPTPTPTGPTPTPPPPSDIKINEIHVNPDGADEGCYVELYNAESVAVNLSSYQLVGINGFDWSEYASVSLTGSIPPGGFFVVAQDASVANYDMIDTLANFQNGPDNIQLRIGSTVVDAVGYGDFGATDVFAGEGDPVPYPTPNNDQSLSRFPDGTDTDNNSVDFSWGLLTPGSGNAPPGTDTPTPPPTSTPTFGPTSTPTSPDNPTATPTMPDEPTVTPTPSECIELGVKIEMPAAEYGPGDDCYMNIVICNPHDQEYQGVPVFVLLDVYGEYFFGPSFSQDLDYMTRTIVSGVEVVEILPMFDWPEGAGAADNIKFVSAMTNPQITQLFGTLDTFTFGWHE